MTHAVQSCCSTPAPAPCHPEAYCHPQQAEPTCAPSGYDCGHPCEGFSLHLSLDVGLDIGHDCGHTFA
jgi:hypothetical protein